ncbi:hypothetical protein SAMN04487764_2700 [Gillisia sp. Hel1_33_143]|nr:hypothetical protein SAMN04487764_2700 [Gillisia sp. Hel1_33_143]
MKLVDTEILYLVFSTYLNVMSAPIKTLELEFTTLEFYSNYVISRVHEEIVFSKQHIQELVEICSEAFKDTKFAYISKRDHVYNVDPNVYRELEIVRKNLMAVAIVSDRVSTLNIAHFEKTFAKVNFEIFISLEDAIDWATGILK